MTLTDMFTSCRLNTPDGDSDQITFLNGVTRSATTAGSAASPGPGFLTGTYASKKQAATVQAPSQCTHRVFLHMWGAATREGGFLKARSPRGAGHSHAEASQHPVQPWPTLAWGRRCAPLPRNPGATGAAGSPECQAPLQPSPWSFLQQRPTAPPQA